MGLDAVDEMMENRSTGHAVKAVSVRRDDDVFRLLHAQSGSTSTPPRHFLGSTGGNALSFEPRQPSQIHWISSNNA